MPTRPGARLARLFRLATGRATMTQVTETQVTEIRTSPGEHLLVMLAERLLTAVPDQPRSPWRPATASR